MPKKPQQQAESNSHALSREDRKNEQICRMIERAEKLRLKKEQKKKLAVSAPTRLLWAIRMSLPIRSSRQGQTSGPNSNDASLLNLFETETKFLCFLPALSSYFPTRI